MVYGRKGRSERTGIGGERVDMIPFLAMITVGVRVGVVVMVILLQRLICTHCSRRAENGLAANWRTRLISTTLNRYIYDRKTVYTASTSIVSI